MQTHTHMRDFVCMDVGTYKPSKHTKVESQAEIYVESGKKLVSRFFLRV